MESGEDVESFIRSTFRSVWALELLILLRQNRDRSLSHDEMVKRLRGSDLVVRQSVDSLAAAGLVIPEAQGDARYSPASAALDALTSKTEKIYARSPDAVRRLIVAAATPGLTAFADAFRLRKD
jgi:predicted transcriptional regulator